MNPDERFVGRDIPASEFGGDEGGVDLAVLAALEAFAGRRLGRAQLLRALSESRVFVPVKAILDSSETDTDGHRVEKDSHMATVSMQTADGRRGLLAFTSIEAFNAWDPGARPVPARLRQAAAAAVDEGADALVLDVAAPHRIALVAQELAALADGSPFELPRAADPATAEAISQVLAPIGAKYECQFELTSPVGDAAVRLNLISHPGLDPVEILNEVAAALQADDHLRSEFADGVELGIATSG